MIGNQAILGADPRKHWACRVNGIGFYRTPGVWSARRLDRVPGVAGALFGLVEALAQLLPGLTAARGRDEARALGPEREVLDAEARLRRR